MKIGLIPPLVSPIATPEYLSTYGRHAEEFGFDSIWLAEHVVLFDEHRSRYPYSESGRMPSGGENGFLETFTALSFLAGQTTRIRLGSGICVVPQRNPVYTAKEAAAIDWLSDGRFDFGIGVGWQAEEFEAVGMPFERRGARCDAFLELIKHLWSSDISSWSDEFYELAPCRMYPKPIQTPHPPIFVGGESSAAMSRVAEHAQGWYGLDLDPEDLPDLLKELDAALSARGRRRDDVEIAVSPFFKGCNREKLARYREYGVDQVIVPGLAPSVESIAPTLEALANELVVPAHTL